MDLLPSRMGLFINTYAARPRRRRAYPSKTLLVFNQSDASSKGIARHYQRLRNIPEKNLLGLKGSNLGKHIVDVEEFKQEILVPILDYLKSKNLSKKILFIIYSTGIPTAVDISNKLDLKKYRITHPTLSTNGLTFFYQKVLQDDLGSILSGTGNLYAETNPYFTSPGKPSQKFSKAGLSPEYYLSSFLGVNKGKKVFGGKLDVNTDREIKDSLFRSVRADNSNPKRLVYLLKNKNIRTSHSSYEYLFTELALKELGIQVANAKIDGNTGAPYRFDDLIGLTTGFAKINPNHNSSFAPGAVVDNLTSYGGMFHRYHSQTTLSEFIRLGAAGASGSVDEPGFNPNKFTSALLHLYYASGLTMIESYYASTKEPQQLLIVGDPLCRPYNVVSAE